MEMKLSLAHMYPNCLKHSEMDVKTITMFKEWVNINCLMKSVNNCKSSRTRCQRLSNNPRIDGRSIARSLGNNMSDSDSSQLIGKEDDLHKVCPTQFCEWDRRGVTTCKDFTHIDHTKSHYLNCIMTGVSVQPWNNISDHGLKNKITETQRVLCAKVEDKNDVASFDRQGVID